MKKHYYPLSHPTEYQKKPLVKDQRIHPAALVACPKFTFKNTVAANYCPQCQYYQGLYQMDITGGAIKEGANWEDVYTVACAFPMERRLMIINVVT